MAPVTDFAVKEKYTYLEGFGNYHSSVASLAALTFVELLQIRGLTRSHPDNQQHAHKARLWPADRAHQRHILHRPARPQYADLHLSHRLIPRARGVRPH